MARALIECVPNFSEGRREDVIEAIVAPFKQTPGVYLFDYRADADHNRLVVSLVGHPDEVCNSLIQATSIAQKHIDLNTHQGAHPRMGAVDVIPFTPISDITMDECVALSRSFGERYQKETGIPVYFYEESAIIPERKRLEVIRKGQYEVLKDEAKTKPERYPDLGGPGLHPTAGGTVIGARKFLVAFNINLDTKDINVAKEIAKFLRGSSGGFCHVKGIGLALEDRGGMAQVSLNLVDYEKNSIYRVLEMARMEAKRFGVNVVETEIYGMVPAAALLGSASYYLQTGIDPDQVLELRLLKKMMEQA